MRTPLTSASLILALLATSVVPQAFGLNIGGRDVSMPNYRQIQKDQFYRRIDKPYNSPFYKRHFEPDGGDRSLLTYLVDSAKLYNVDPVAVLGAIMGEHTMNQRSQLKKAGEKGIEIIGKNFGSTGEKVVNELNVVFLGANGEASFGPGQIQPFIADYMQGEIKKFRPQASEGERDKYTWKGAINIMCAYMNYAAKKYEAEGFKVRNDPALLVTLYNLGEVGKSFEKRAAETKEQVEAGERDGPWINYFGYWLLRNKKKLDDAIASAPAE